MKHSERIVAQVRDMIRAHLDAARLVELVGKGGREEAARVEASLRCRLDEIAATERALGKTLTLVDDLAELVAESFKRERAERPAAPAKGGA